MTAIRDTSTSTATEPAAPYQHQRVLNESLIEIEETSGTIFAEVTGHVLTPPSDTAARKRSLAVPLAVLALLGGLAVFFVLRRRERPKVVPQMLLPLPGGQGMAANVS